ncbi:hypothetical protein BCR39DRAFT_503559 [Naematelia encephala]|uniref:Uncharacterized protein n=1 Tax=Naematelia encephala TaxID=71784 RepID=A0A1Y2BHH4_9TREE|nr:hypothetical protein BCR39DRAFT_503559 [Naematelia encephala]
MASSVTSNDTWGQAASVGEAAEPLSTMQPLNAVARRKLRLRDGLAAVFPVSARAVGGECRKGGRGAHKNTINHASHEDPGGIKDHSTLVQALPQSSKGFDGVLSVAKSSTYDNLLIWTAPLSLPASRDQQPSKLPSPMISAATDFGTQTPLAMEVQTQMSTLSNLEQDEQPPYERKGKGRAFGERPMEGKPQISRRNSSGPGSIVDLSSRQAEQISRISPPSRRAPPRPLTPSGWSPRYAAIDSSSPLPSSSIQATFGYDQRSALSARQGVEVDMIEIPRFKTRGLNLTIVMKSGPWQRVAWLSLWMGWITNGLLSLFVIHLSRLTLRCAIHPSSENNSNRSWTFAAAAYGVCLGLSTLLVWCGWEMYYEFWRRWRLLSFPHFAFFSHIRLSPLGTPYAFDVITETAYALVQLAPGLLPLVPRAAIAAVLLLSFSTPATQSTSVVTQSRIRDPNFFVSDSQLNDYARGLLIAFVSLVAFRLAVVLLSVAVLFLISDHSNSGHFGRWFLWCGPRSDSPQSISVLRDSSRAGSPQKPTFDHENVFKWPWKERTRARIQDAFNLCMIRRGAPQEGFPTQLISQRVGVNPIVKVSPVEREELLSEPGPSRPRDPHRFPFQQMALKTSLHAAHTPVPTSLAHSRSDGLITSSNTHTTPTAIPFNDPASPSVNVQTRPASGESTKSDDDGDSTALLSDSPTAKSSLQCVRDRASSFGSRMSLAIGHALTQSKSSTSSSSNSDTSPNKRRDAPKIYHESSLSRARSTSVSLLREGVRNAATAGESMVRRARSGTMLSLDTRYSPISRREDENEARENTPGLDLAPLVNVDLMPEQPDVWCILLTRRLGPGEGVEAIQDTKIPAVSSHPVGKWPLV